MFIIVFYTYVNAVGRVFWDVILNQQLADTITRPV